MSYRPPWTAGAKAYPQADTMADVWEGVRRKRNRLTVHVAHAGLKGVMCAGCGHALDGPYPVNDGEEPTHVDRLGYAYVDVNPRAGTALARHYYCAWGAVMANVLALHRP